MTADRIAFPLFLAMVALLALLFIFAPTVRAHGVTCTFGSYGAEIAGCPGR